METATNTIEKWFRSMTFKMAVLAVLGLMLLIPLEMVKDVIKERAAYASEVKSEIGTLWAAAQTITGPVLNVPGSKKISDDGAIATTTLHILPEELDIVALVTPEIRYRGIYETVVYDSEVKIEGRFQPEGADANSDYTYDWSRAYFTLGVSDNKGLKDQVIFRSGDRAVEAEPGTVQADVFQKGISFRFPGESINSFEGTFDITLRLKGSEGIYFSPVGKTTRVTLTSPWNAPSFQGNFLPSEREISEEGFSASWVVTHLNRNFPQVWTGGGYTPESDSFGADLMLEVDHYTKTERSAKYGLLFIALTFFVLIMVEVRTSQNISIFYYVLTGFALIIFFSLMSALSEHAGFSAAYLIASAATIGLLSLFFRSLLQKGWIVLVVSGMLTVLYSFIFVLLALKDYAYLAGNIGLFILLAVLMLVSSKYKLFRN
jgi:inner membrane protein